MNINSNKSLPLADTFVPPLLASSEINPASKAALEALAPQMSPVLPRVSPLSIKPIDEDFSTLDEVGEAFDQMVMQRSKPLPPNHPFHDTDLIVFDDEYKGLLPLNGIRESDLKKATELYEKITQEKGKIRFPSRPYDLSWNKGCTNKLKEWIKILLTRKTGRDLLERIENSEIPYVNISFYDDSSHDGIDNAHNEDDGGYSIDLGPDTVIVCRRPDGKKELLPLPRYISLGHELIHVMHYKEVADIGKPPTLGQQFTNLDEQITIVGLKKPIAGIEEENLSEEYCEINENNLRSEFGITCRYSHHVFAVPRTLLVAENTVDDWGGMSQSFVSTFNYLVREGLVEELEDVIFANKGVNWKQLKGYWGFSPLLEGSMKEAETGKRSPEMQTLLKELAK